VEDMNEKEFKKLRHKQTVAKGRALRKEQKELIGNKENKFEYKIIVKFNHQKTLFNMSFFSDKKDMTIEEIKEQLETRIKNKFEVALCQ